jgi:hypothetical protein
MLFLFRAMRKQSIVRSGLGWLFALAAQFSRQAALAVPLAFGGAYLVRNGVTVRRLLVALFPFFGFIAVQRLYEIWLRNTGRLPSLFARQLDSVIPTLSSASLLGARLLEIVLYCFFYLGFFLLPLTLPLAASLFHAIRRPLWWVVAYVTGIVCLSSLSFHLGLIMPIWNEPNYWRVSGIGADVVGLKSPPWFFPVVTVFSILGGVLLVTCLVYVLIHGVKATRARGALASEIIFALLGATALAGMLIFVEYKFDRYLLPLIPWLALAVVHVSSLSQCPVSAWSYLVGVACLAGMGWYSITNMHNYAIEKRTVEKALSELLARGVPRETINAGWTFNGDQLYDRFRKKRPSGPWLETEDFIISAHPRSGFKLIATYPVNRWPLWGSKGSPVRVYGLHEKVRLWELRPATD